MRKFIGNRLACLTMLLLPFLIGCGQQRSSSQENNVVEFEGIITYKIIYINNAGNALYGDTMKLYYSKGNLIKQYNGKSAKGLKKELFNGGRNSYYMNIGLSDTLYSYDISKDDRVLLSSDLKYSDTTILGHSCNKIEFNQLHVKTENFYIYNSYWYSDKVLKINPEHFKGWNYGGFNKFINKTGVLYLRFQTSIEYYGKKDLVTKIYEAVIIETKRLDPKIFAVDSSLITPFKMR